MSSPFLETLADHFRSQDIAINACRLIPRIGWLVEFEHWYHESTGITCSVAFIKMTDNRGGQKIEWVNPTHKILNGEVIPFN